MSPDEIGVMGSKGVATAVPLLEERLEVFTSSSSCSSLVEIDVTCLISCLIIASLGDNGGEDDSMIKGWNT